MGILDFLKNTDTVDINRGIEEFKNTEGAVLIDARSPEEYAGGRISGSKNYPLQKAAAILEDVPDKGTHIFVYCLSGVRSRRIVAFLQSSGYENIVDLGGMSGYKGTLEK